MDEVLTLDEVAKLLKVSKRTVQREVEQERLVGFHVGRALRFYRSSVDDYAEKQKTQTVKERDDTDTGALQHG